ncbi:MAG: hypothetical protein GTO18_06855 [Anaerolineales bacterium]|nr:hypothetical protein [Anaerolineales bacterium]
MSTTRLELDVKDERRRIDALWWGGTFIWAGLIFGVDALGYLPQIGESDAWSWIFLGVGAYSLLISLLRVASSAYSNPKTWEWIFGGFLLVVGLGGMVTLVMFWPVVLMLVGASILGGLFFSNKS